MNRRQLLIGASASALARPGAAQAAFSNHEASWFSGNTVLKANSVAAMPSGLVTQAFIELLVALPPSFVTAKTDIFPLTIGAGTKSANYIQLIMASNASTGVFELGITDAKDQPFGVYVTNTNRFCNDQFIQVLANIDSVGRFGAFTINGAVQTVHYTQPPAGGFSNLGAYLSGQPVLVGSQTTQAPVNGLEGGVARFMFYPNQNIRANDPKVIAAFWNASLAQPWRFDPMGVSALAGKTPAICLAGGPNELCENYARGSFSWPDAMVSASPFAVAAGALADYPSGGSPWNQPAAAARRR